MTELWIELPVLWGDMDAFLHVNNIQYLRWIETARVHYLKASGLYQREDNIGIILARTEIDYRIPLVFPDTVRVNARVTEIGRTSFTMYNDIVSIQHNEKTAALAKTVLVVYDYNTLQKVVIDEALKSKLRTIK